MRLLDPANPAAWLLGSFFLIVLGTNLAWVFVRRRATRPGFQLGPLAAGGWLALGLFYLIAPFLALQRGAVSPYTLGLTGVNWPATLSNGLVLAATVVAVALFGWLVYRRTLPEAAPRAAMTRLVDGLRAALDAALDQWHWAFYRAAAAGAVLLLPPALGPVATKAQAEPLYWGAWLGLALAGIEWTLNPFGRAALRAEATRPAVIRRAALGIATTGIFVLTRNFWLCLAAHLAVETLAAIWFALPEQPVAQPD